LVEIQSRLIVPHIKKPTPWDKETCFSIFFSLDPNCFAVETRPRQPLCLGLTSWLVSSKGTLFLRLAIASFESINFKILRPFGLVPFRVRRRLNQTKTCFHTFLFTVPPRKLFVGHGPRYPRCTVRFGAGGRHAVRGANKESTNRVSAFLKKILTRPCN